ncbi:MAG: biotin/lipoyl-binding protein [Sphingomonadales bacterium]|nr:biotin/lipoyl-binding protein [Sphingomonadales bacterium]
MLAKPSWLARVSARLDASKLLSLRLILLALVPALVVIVAFVFYLFSGRYISTDNAYVGAEKVLITPEVSGKVVKIAVVEGQLLKPGDELLAIDPVPYRLAAQEAEAKLVRVQSDFATLKANLASVTTQAGLSRQSLAAAQSDFDRKTQLLSNRISTPSDVDKSRSGADCRQGPARAS